ncbi:MAG TPA: DUF1223 domain-containing protein [Gammaproteobacteria bacterium]|nr:DUF1223 domain-containing protein [Gammaproteobacteria bacterium]
MLSTRWTMLIPVAALALPMTAGAAPQIISSGVTRVSLLELYTSEGCSSCPPAEGWFSTLTDDKRLWTQLVPVAFHVDYWDDLGWRDPFDSHTYSERQQRLANRVGDGVIYTPEFVLDGKPWANWFNLRSLRLPDATDTGRLKLIVDGARIAASFIPVNADYKYLELHVAILAFGVNTKVGAGENAGRTLHQDFLVIGYRQHPLTATAAGFTVAMQLPQRVNVQAARYALAAWVSVPGDPAPIQSAGGWLDAVP